MSDETEQALLDELRRLHDAVGVPPRTVDMGRHGRFSPALYADRFGSWEDALNEAGIDGEPRRPPEDAVVEDISGTEKTEGDAGDTDVEDDEPSDENLRAIRRCYKRVEGTPTPDDLRGRGHSVNEVLDEHGTWKDALEAAGVETEYIDPSPDDRRQRGENGKLLEELRRYANLRGEKPSAEDLRKTDWAESPDEYRDVFGSVAEAVAEAFKDDVTEDRDEDELIDEIKRYYLREGSAPDADDVRTTDWMSSVERYHEVFGDVGQAVEYAGIDG